MSVSIGYNNLINSATLSGGSWSTPFPLANIQNRLLTLFARSSNALTTSTVFTMDLGIAKPIKAFGALNTNISTAGTYQLIGASDSGFTSVLFNSGTVSTAKQTPNLIISVKATTARYWKLQINDTTNADGFIKIGRVFIGTAFTPEFGASYGIQRGYKCNTSITPSIAEFDFSDSRPVRRNTLISFNLLSDAEEEEVMELQVLSNMSAEVLFIENTGDTTYNQRRNFLARLNTLNPLTQPHFALHQTSFDLLEIIGDQKIVYTGNLSTGNLLYDVLGQIIYDSNGEAIYTL